MGGKRVINLLIFKPNEIHGFEAKRYLKLRNEKVPINV